MTVKTISIGPETRKKIDKLVSAAAGTKRAVVAALDRRHTSGKNYAAYERYLLSDGCTVFISLKTMKATVSDKPNKHSVSLVERKERRKAARAARKQARLEAKARSKREAKLEAWAAKKGVKQAKAVKVKSKAKAKRTAGGIPIVKYDPKIPTLELGASRRAQ